MDGAVRYRNVLTGEMRAEKRYRNVHTGKIRVDKPSVLDKPPRQVKPEHITAQIELDRTRADAVRRKRDARWAENRKKLKDKEDAALYKA